MKNNFDQFYTKPEIAEYCYNFLKSKYNLNNFLLFEPSAGTGSFSDLFHSNSISIDIEPKKNYILQKDFLKFDDSIFINKNVFTIGNPPFGKNSSLAITFFNKASLFSDYIGFIVPKTFKKKSVINRLNLKFKLEYEIDIPLESFIYENNIYSVPCIFQVWKKTDKLRKKIKNITHSKFFEFCKKNDNAYFAIRRVGGLAGKLIIDYIDYKESSHYYIISKIDKNKLILTINNLYNDLHVAANNCAGNPSLSKHELISIVDNKLEYTL